MNLEKEPTMYKVGAYCGICNHDYGVLERVKRSGISGDEVFEHAEDEIDSFFE